MKAEKNHGKPENGGVFEEKAIAASMTECTGIMQWLNAHNPELDPEAEEHEASLYNVLEPKAPKDEEEICREREGKPR